jgi:RNA polymerase sigma factor (sigma-70 family)
VSNNDVIDLVDAYSADLETIERLSPEEHDALIRNAGEQNQSSLDRETRNKLLEEYLPLAKNMVLKLCPSAYQYLLPDMLGDLNLTLVQAMERIDPHAMISLKAYICSYIRGSIRETINRRRVLHIPPYAVRKMVNEERWQDLNQLVPLSMQALVAQRPERREAPERKWQPLLPTEALPEPHQEQQALIMEWLSHLLARDEQIVRLHYGLVEGDERTYTVAEITRLLGLSYETIDDTIKRSLLRLRKMAEGNARFREQDGRMVVKGILHAYPLPTLTPEQETRFWQATHMLGEQRIVVSARNLNKACGLSFAHARVFLLHHREEIPPHFFLRPTVRQKYEQQQQQMDR